MDALFHSATRQAPTAQKVFSPLKKKTSAENVDNTWDQRTPDGEEDDDDKLNAHLLRVLPTLCKIFLMLKTFSDRRFPADGPLAGQHAFGCSV